MNNISKITTAETLAEQSGVAEDARPLEVITEEIQFYKSQAGAACLEIGKRLAEAKALLPHGKWSDWLRDEVAFSERAAQNFIRLAAEYSNPQPVADLGSTKALILLALPASEREDFMAQSHVVDGSEKKVDEMSKRELERVIKELEAEKKKTQDLQEQLTFKLDSDAITRVSEIENAKALAEKAKARLQEKEEELEQLRAEMEDLKENPPALDLAEDQMEQLRRDAEEQARKEAESKLKKQIEKAEADKKAAKDELAAQTEAHKLAEAAMKREKETLAEKAEELQKKLAVAASSDIAIFKVYFENAQDAANKMIECIKRLADAGDTENQGKLSAALRAYCTKVPESLPEVAR